jgi:hypothetical protein
MDEKRTSGAWVPAVLMVMFSLTATAVLYFVSLGPFFAYCSRNSTPDWVGVYFEPADRMQTQSEVFGMALAWYVSRWVPMDVPIEESHASTLPASGN